MIIFHTEILLFNLFSLASANAFSKKLIWCCLYPPFLQKLTARSVALNTNGKLVSGSIYPSERSIDFISDCKEVVELILQMSKICSILKPELSSEFSLPYTKQERTLSRRFIKSFCSLSFIGKISNKYKLKFQYRDTYDFFSLQ